MRALDHTGMPGEAVFPDAAEKRLNPRYGDGRLESQGVIYRMAAKQAQHGRLISDNNVVLAKKLVKRKGRFGFILADV